MSTDKIDPKTKDTKISSAKNTKDELSEKELEKASGGGTCAVALTRLSLLG